MAEQETAVCVIPSIRFRKRWSCTTKINCANWRRIPKGNVQHRGWKNSPVRGVRTACVRLSLASRVPAPRGSLRPIIGPFPSCHHRSKKVLDKEPPWWIAAVRPQSPAMRGFFGGRTPQAVWAVIRIRSGGRWRKPRGPKEMKLFSPPWKPVLHAERMAGSNLEKSEFSDSYFSQSVVVVCVAKLKTHQGGDPNGKTKTIR